MSHPLPKIEIGTTIGGEYDLSDRTLQLVEGSNGVAPRWPAKRKQGDRPQLKVSLREGAKQGRTQSSIIIVVLVDPVILVQSFDYSLRQLSRYRPPVSPFNYYYYHHHPRPKNNSLFLPLPRGSSNPPYTCSSLHGPPPASDLESFYGGESRVLRPTFVLTMTTPSPPASPRPSLADS